MEWLEASEVVFGLVWEGRRLPSAYSADDFAPPYNEGMQVFQHKNGGKEDVVKVLAQKFLNNAKDAVRNLNGLGDESVYDEALVRAAQAFRLGKKLEKAGVKLQKNEPIDYLPLYGELSSVVSGDASGPMLASEIGYDHYKPFIKTGYAPIDSVIGGFPSDGPIVIYGPTGVGKSHLSAILTGCMLAAHKDWTSIVYTLEMSAEHWLWREVQMYPELKPVMNRLYVSGAVRNIEELVAEVTAKKVNFAVIDDLDGLVEDETPSAYQRCYKRVKEICRFLKIPVIVLAQPNRMAKLSGNFMRPYDIAWTGSGENSAALLIGLSQANDLDMEDDLFPVDDDNHFYMIFWKSRDGWPVQHGPGAIILEENKAQLWKGNFYQKKAQLWSPNSGKRTIGKRKSNK